MLKGYGSASGAYMWGAVSGAENEVMLGGAEMLSTYFWCIPRMERAVSGAERIGIASGSYMWGAVFGAERIWTCFCCTHAESCLWC